MAGLSGIPQREKLYASSPERFNQLYEAYLLVYDSFATGTTQVADELDVSKDSARKILKQLENVGLVAGEDVNGEAQGIFRRGEYKDICWQCWETHDSINREEAIAKFHAYVTSDASQRPLTSYAVAQQIAKELRRIYGKDITCVVWSAKDMRKFVHHTCTMPGVMWEEGPYDWAIETKESLRQIAEENGFYLEAMNSYCVAVAQ